MSLAVLAWTTSSPTRGNLKFGRGHDLQAVEVVMTCSADWRILEDDEELRFDLGVAKKVRKLSKQDTKW